MTRLNNDEQYYDIVEKFVILLADLNTNGAAVEGYLYDGRQLRYHYIVQYDSY